MEMSQQATAVDLSPAGEVRARQSRRWRAIRESLTCYLFLLPYLALFVVFVLIPFFWAIWLSFQEGGIMSPPVFVRLDNYAGGLGDQTFQTTILNTLRYVVTVVPAVTVLGVLIALVTNSPTLRGRSIFRAIVFFPVLASAAAIGRLWQYMLLPKYGLVNYVLGFFGIPQIRWLDPAMAMNTVVMVALWGGLGFYVLVYLAAMQDIPTDLLDAARVDGANGRQVVWHVTIPCIRPVLLFTTTMAIIWGFQMFDIVYVLTNGGPLYRTATIVWYIYNSAFKWDQLGKASAMGVVLLVIILAITLIQRRVFREEIQQ
jgi:multiple sugar transport system permease protein